MLTSSFLLGRHLRRDDEWPTFHNSANTRTEKERLVPSGGNCSRLHVVRHRLVVNGYLARWAIKINALVAPYKRATEGLWLSQLRVR